MTRPGHAPELFHREKETARFLGITPKKLDELVTFFDAHDDDEWELNEGEHFIWVRGRRNSDGTRAFTDAGVMALAKYLKEIRGETLWDRVLEFITRKHARTCRELVLHHVRGVLDADRSIYSRNDLMFMSRRSTIAILGTNGKGLNNSHKRIDAQSGTDPDNQEAMKLGTDFEINDDGSFYSQTGLVKVALDLQRNPNIRTKKPRRLWLKAVAESMDQAVIDYRRQIQAANAALEKAKLKARKLADHRCELTGQKQDRNNPRFRLAVHHLYDAHSHNRYACSLDNLLVIDELLHQEYHGWATSQKLPTTARTFREWAIATQSHLLENSTQANRYRAVMLRLEQAERLFGSP